MHLGQTTFCKLASIFRLPLRLIKLDNGVDLQKKERVRKLLKRNEDVTRDLSFSSLIFFYHRFGIRQTPSVLFFHLLPISSGECNQVQAYFNHRFAARH